MTPRAYATGWFLLLAVPAFAWYLSTVGPLRSLAFRVVVSEPVYLANLREPELSCRTLSLRKPELLVLGDSHSYAAWDFAQLERRLGLRTGACALGGLYAESVPALVEMASRASPRAKLLVLGLSPRMFWESPSREEQLAHHRLTIPGMSPNPVPFMRRAFLRESLPHDHEAESVERHESKLEALDENLVLRKLDRSQDSIRTLRDWSQRLREIRFTTGQERMAAEICGKVKAAGLRMWVLHVPESPYLESRYPGAVWDAYRVAVNTLGACAERIVLDQATTYGLGNRHFVNRQLRDIHDYSGWANSAPLIDDLAFDADHLNPVGARQFTRLVLDRLGAAKP